MLTGFSRLFATVAWFSFTAVAQAVTFELVDNGVNFDAIVSQEAGDPEIFAVDMFIRASAGAELSVANNDGNPFDRPVFNNMPPGNPGTVLIGGSDISGRCQDSGTSCFSDAACGTDTCVFGQSGAIKLGEVNWNGVGTVSLKRGTAVGAALPQEIPTTNLSGCQLITEEEVLAGDDLNGNGIVRACECADANQSGQHEADDLFRVFFCIADGEDPTGQNEPCRTLLHNGDGQNSGAFESADLFVAFNSAFDLRRTLRSTCPARPEPVEPF